MADRAARAAIKHWALRLESKLPPLARARHGLRRWKRRLRPPGEPIFVYQVGKVGSLSVAHALRALPWNRPVHHVHYANPVHDDLSPAERLNPRGHVTDGAAAEALRNARDSNRPVTVICLVREPASRNISAFFENVRGHYPRYEAETREGRLDLDALIDVFLERFPHKEPLEWLDVELKEVLGVDVYDGPFAKPRGWGVYESPSVKALLLRAEDLTRVAPEAFGEFLGLKDFSVGQVNVAGMKHYRDAYRAFRERIRFPRDLLELLYESRFARHFYSPEEIEGFRSRWRVREGDDLGRCGARGRGRE